MGGNFSMFRLLYDQSGVKVQFYLVIVAQQGQGMLIVFHKTH